MQRPTKYAPFAKKQKRDAIELFILAGDKAFDPERKELLRMAIQAGNDFQPIVLNDENLAEVSSLKLTTDHNKNTVQSIRIYQAGQLQSSEKDALLLNIAEHTPASTVVFFNDAEFDHYENLSSYIQRTRQGETLLKMAVEAEQDKHPPKVKQDDKVHIKAKIFQRWLNIPLVLHDQSNEIYQYTGKVWEKLPTNHLTRLVREFYEENEMSYSGSAIKNLIETLITQLEPMGEQSGDYIAFDNGLLERTTGQFIAHDRNHWLVSVIPHDYNPANQATPNFDKWVQFVANGNPDKAKAIMAALYMILTNRYDWQLFLEITGEGGTGKSVFAHLATMLAGEKNTVSSDLDGMENPRERGKLVDKSLIICPDQPKYNGSGATLKAITGGDLIAVNPKYKDPFDTIIKAVVILVNNEPMRFTERNGGIERRRVIIKFDRPVPVESKDFQLLDKLTLEAGGIIKKLLDTFTEADGKRARLALDKQANSHEAKTIKEESDPFALFCSYLQTSSIVDGLYIGNARMPTQAVQTHLYPAYLAFADANNIKFEMSLPAFSKALTQGLKQNGSPDPVEKKRTMKGIRTNIHFINFNEFFEDALRCRA